MANNVERINALRAADKESAPRGIPFSSPDEAKGDEFLDRAKLLVQDWYWQYDEEPAINSRDIYIVWFSYILGNWKALVSTSRPDGRYFEVTHDAAKKRTYVDVYIKAANQTIKSN